MLLVHFYTTGCLAIRNISCDWFCFANQLSQKDYKSCLLKRETGTTHSTTLGARFTSKQQDV